MVSRRQNSKQISRPPQHKAVQAPAVAKVAAPVKKQTVLDVKAVGSVRVLHDGRAIVSVDGDTETISASKVQITIED